MKQSTDLVEKLVRSGECVVFIGAGLSVPIAKNWNGLVETIAEQCKVNFDTNDLPYVIDKCIEKNESLCDKILKEEYPTITTLTRTAMSDLLKLKFKAILTTNFDPWISLRSERENYQEVFVYPILPATKPIDKNIYYLHGRVDSEAHNSSIRNLVFGKNSFKDAYTNSLLTGLLLNLLVYKRILFIGFNPTEENFRRLIETSIKILKLINDKQDVALTTPRHFCLLPQPDRSLMDKEKYKEAEHTIREIKALDIKPELYRMENENHIGLEKLIDRWRLQGDTKYRPPKLSTGFEIID